MKKFFILCIKFLVLSVLFTVFTLYFPLCERTFANSLHISDKKRQDNFINLLHRDGIIPSDISFDTRYCTRDFRENKYVFAGFVTNVSFLTETNAIAIIRTKKLPEMSASKAYRWFDARQEYDQPSGYINYLIRSANIPFECTSDTPLFYMYLDINTVWVALYDNRIIVVVLCDT